jgi:hypothetical protein
VAGFSSFYIGGISQNLSICTGSTITIPSAITGSSYQWQVDNGSGYTNVVNNATYSGSASKALTISNAAGGMYGYKYRCLVNGNTSRVYA